MKVSLLIVLTSFYFLLPLSASPSALDETRAKRTVFLMLQIRGALAAFEVDHNRYPKASDIKELETELAPQYIEQLPIYDAWGTPYHYVTDAEQHSYWLISYGADKKADLGSYTTGGVPRNSEPRVTNDYSADIILLDGSFVAAPKGMEFISEAFDQCFVLLVKQDGSFFLNTNWIPHKEAVKELSKLHQIKPTPTLFFKVERGAEEKYVKMAKDAIDAAEVKNVESLSPDALQIDLTIGRVGDGYGDVAKFGDEEVPVEEFAAFLENAKQYDRTVRTFVYGPVPIVLEKVVKILGNAGFTSVTACP